MAGLRWRGYRGRMSRVHARRSHHRLTRRGAYQGYRSRVELAGLRVAGITTCRQIAARSKRCLQQVEQGGMLLISGRLKTYLLETVVRHLIRPAHRIEEGCY